MQRRILSFIHQYWNQFPQDDLVRLIESIPSKEISDDWIKVLVNMIRRRCKYQGKTFSESIYTFSPASESNLKNFDLALQARGVSLGFRSDTLEKSLNIKTEDMICDSDKEDDSMEAASVEETEQTLPMEFSSQRPSFEKSFLSQRSHFLEGDMQVKIQMIN